MPTKSLLVLTQTPIICNTLFLHAQKILLSFFTVKHGQSINFSETKNFFALFDSYSRQYLFKIMTLRVFPQLSKISKFINLYKNSSGHLSSFHQRCAPLENTSGSHSGCVIPESIVSHFSSFLSCVLTGQWVNFTAAYVTFENTSPFLSLSLYDPTAMILHHFDLYTQQPYRGYDDLTMMSSSHWRHHHSLTWPLRTTSFLYSLAPSLSSSRSSSRPSRLLRSLYLFRKLNGRVLSHSCGYSFRQRAWPSFRDIRISRISSDTIDSQFLKGSFLLPFDSIIFFYSRWNFLGYFDASDIDFSSPFSNIISFFFFLFLFLLVFVSIERDRKQVRLGNREIEFQDDPY